MVRAMMARLVLIALSLSLMSPGLGFDQPALAYVLETTAAGESLQWPQSCVTWWMHEEGANVVGEEASREALRRSFDTWQEIDDLGVEFVEGGVTCHRAVGFDQGFGQQNIILWHNEPGSWPYTERIIGLTTLTFDTESGEIVDVDMEFNGEDFRFATDGSPSGYDLQTAITHEVGHMLGLGHASASQSVMFPAAMVGDTSKRELSDDDIEGAIAAHGLNTGVEQTACDGGEPATFDAPYCPQPAANGCQSGGRSSLPLEGGVAALICLLFFTRRRRAWGLRGLSLAVTLMMTAWVGGEVYAQACNPYAISDGTPVYWTIPRIALEVDDQLPEGIDAQAWLRIVEDSLSPWTSLDCLLWDVEVINEGFSTCPGEIVDDERQCIYWVNADEGWPFSSWQLAVTLVHYRTDNGHIVDTDMALNGTGTFDWSLAEQCDPEGEQHDLQATLTHEFGHLLGLDHSSTAQATMSGTTREADCIKRSLHETDISCICETMNAHPQPWLEQTDTSASTSEGMDASEDTTAGSADALEPASTSAARGCRGGRVGFVTPALVMLWLFGRARRRFAQ